MPGRLVEVVATLLLVIVAGSLLLGTILGQPVLLSYVETGSMEPTLKPGDGFVAIPASLTGEIEPGDVITFRAKRLNDGGLTTHRVVERTEQGFITKGDANPFTDQDGDEPPVQRVQIVAEALQFQGGVISIPYLGVVVAFLQGILTGLADAVGGIQRQLAIMTGNRAFLGRQGLGYLLFGMGLLAYVASVLFGDEVEGRSRDTGGRGKEGIDAKVAVAGLAMLMVTAATVSMALPAGTQTFDVVSADTDSPRPGVIRSGSTENTTIAMTNGGVLPVEVRLQPGDVGIGVEPESISLGGGQTANATVTLEAPDQTGFFPRYLSQHWYLGVLPRGVIDGLYDVHPWFPVVVIDAIIGLVSALIGVAVLGTGRIRFRSRNVGWLDRYLS